MLNHGAAALDRVFQALADPTRRVMIERLSRGPASVSQLAEPLPITLAAVVQHLQVLEQSGVVRTEKIGRVRTCRLEERGLAAAEGWITQRRLAWERRLDRLGELLAEEHEHERKACATFGSASLVRHDTPKGSKGRTKK